jgi:uncharacterized membrane-anchored protein
MNIHRFCLVPLAVIVWTLGLSTPAFAKPGTPKPAGAVTPATTAAPSVAAPAPSASGGDEDDDGPPLPWKIGPQRIDLGHGATLDLPAGRRFLGLPEAAQLMEKMGNLYNDDLLGIAVSEADDADYVVSLRYDEEGFIKDDDKLDAKELLDSIRSGEDEYNEERKKRGFSPIHAEGWFEEPAYDKASHKLTWALTVSDAEGSSINLSTRVLGRRGYVSVTLLADPAKLALYRGDGKGWVDATTFTAGSRYSDFDGSKDKVAEYGLAGLIVAGVGVGVAKAAKVGLLAALWKPIVAFLVAAKKAVIAGVVALVALAKKLFGGKRAEKPAAPTA